MQKLTIQVDKDILARVKVAFPELTIEDIVRKTLRKLLADDELRKFAEAKRAEVEAEAARLNKELSVG